MLNKYVFGKITEWIDQGSPLDIICLAFQKVVDKAPHQRLLLNCNAHGIVDGVVDWIDKWLNDRRQCVVVDGEFQTDNNFSVGYHTHQ